MIWYPYNKSAEFPELGVGGRCAMGVLYHYDAKIANKSKMPSYYDKALFVYDWMQLDICRKIGRKPELSIFGAIYASNR
jgi:hypothetical protein